MQSPGRYLHDNRSVINSAVLRSQHQNLYLEDFVGMEPFSFVIDTLKTCSLTTFSSITIYIKYFQEHILHSLLFVCAFV